MERSTPPQVKQIFGLTAFAAACLAAGMGLSHHWVASAQEPQPVTVDVKGLDRLPPITEVAEKLNPTVVAIKNTTFVKGRQAQDPFGGDDFFNFFFGPGQRRQPREDGDGGGGEQRAVSGGSGVIIDPSGEILTNNHVIEGWRGGEANSLEVTISDGRSFKATVLGRDKELDIALIKIDAQQLPFAKLGDSDKVKVGEWVVAIGNPLGLEHTVTQGIISAKGRRIEGGLSSFLQTDAAINRGNSGGPLLNLRGEVVGINTLIRADGQNIGFAVPISQVTRIIKDLRAGRPVSRGYLGIQTAPLDSAFQQSLGVRQGVVVSGVERGQAADKAGLQRLDVITAVDGQIVRSPDDLVNAVSARRAGEQVRLTVVRDGKTVNLEATLGDRKNMKGQDDADGQDQGDAAPRDKEDSKSLNLEKSYGFNVENLSPATRYQFGIGQEVKGVVVTYVSPRSEAADRLAPGWVVTAVGRQNVASVAEFNAQVRKASGKPLLLLLQAPRGGQSATVAIPPR
ncbi:MAG TPA: trypsin-like peptidase domain-containing protein [Holophagaceae bacterium]|nr:trypsin-like peptidase domain-containing protein [Holophagaceae bacterium]